MPRPPLLRSLWHQNLKPRRRRSTFKGKSKFNVVILGGGMTGLSAALHLSRAGLRVAVLEASQIGCGSTGFSSAQLSTLWDGRLSQVGRAGTLKAAALVAYALQRGINLIEELSHGSENTIQFRRLDGYLFDERGDSQSELLEELATARACGLEAKAVSSLPLHIPIRSALRIRNQAVFHPVAYLHHLAEQIEKAGGKIYENSRATDFSSTSPFEVQVGAAGHLTSDQLIVATHTPLGTSPLHSLIAPYRSFVALARVPTKAPLALFWDMAKPYHFIRPYEARDGSHYLIIGGKDRKTAHGDEKTSFADLRTYVHQHFPEAEITGEWSAQLFEPLDHLPLIGRAPLNSDLLVATGYSGDGLPFGSFAGWELAEQAMGRSTPWTELLSPRRWAKTGYGDFLSENWDVAKHMLADRLMAASPSRAEQIAPGEALIVGPMYSPRALYRDETGELFDMSAVCPHMGGIVHWNATERSFDCPCHGSRFNCKGEVIEGPALHGLKRNTLNQEQPSL